MSRETTIGLTLVLVVCTVFGVLVFKKMQEPAVVEAGQSPETQAANPAVTPKSPATKSPVAGSGTPTANAAATPQKTPAATDDDFLTSLDAPQSSRQSVAKNLAQDNEFSTDDTPPPRSQPPKKQLALPVDLDETTADIPPRRTATPPLQDEPLEFAVTDAAESSIASPLGDSDPFESENTPSMSNGQTEVAFDEETEEQANPVEFATTAAEPLEFQDAASPRLNLQAEPAEFDSAPQFAQQTEQPAEEFQSPTEGVPETLNFGGQEAQQIEATGSDVVVLEDPATSSARPLPVTLTDTTDVEERPYENARSTQRSAPKLAQVSAAEDDPFGSEPAETPALQLSPTPKRVPAPANEILEGDTELLPVAKPVRRVAEPRSLQGSGESFDPMPAPGPIAGNRYVVQPNDNFWDISKRKYGDGRFHKALAEANRQAIPDPTNMKPGVAILLPSTDDLQRNFANIIPAPARPVIPPPVPNGVVLGTHANDKAPGMFLTDSGETMYRVGPGDNLNDIARKCLGRSSRWVQIQYMNREILKGDKDLVQLQIGTVLRLPADASLVRMSNLDREIR